MSTRISLGFAGTLALGYGCVHLLLSSHFSHSVLDRLRALEPASAAAVRGLRAGEPVLVEGTLSEANPRSFGSFVAYRRTSSKPAEKEDPTQLLLNLELVTPPLQLNVAGGMVQLEADYDLLETPHGKLTKLYAYSGFHRGDRVFAVGKASGRGSILTETLVGGPRDKYLFVQTGKTWVSYAVDAFAILLGGGLLALSLLAGRARQPAQPRR
ncbi:hypothetical protein [Hymenobacter sp. B81]|uniref:hypothetical protein n=1 Tax=Hymenobacter sp. B81 TaxID=3344878 RepID=UPI0037DDAAEB